MSTTRSRTSFQWTRLPRTKEPDQELDHYPDSDEESSDPRASLAMLVTGKRSREDDSIAYVHYAQQGRGPSDDRPAKRRRGPELVPIYKPFPCGFGARCRFRATCSYHHGIAQRCDCDNVTCAKGHPHRRAPRRCIHGSRCRWMTLGECSFHHGCSELCTCDDFFCLKAHHHRVVRQTEIRQEHKKRALKSTQRNERKLFVGNVPFGTTEDELKACFENALRQGSSLEETALENAVTNVSVLPTDRYAFMEFQSSQLATACLALNGIMLPGDKGRITIQRPADFDASLQEEDEEGTAIHLVTTFLDIAAVKRSTKEKRGSTGATKNASKGSPKKAKKAKKAKSHYQIWKRAQKSGETNLQKRKRYMELFPHGVVPKDEMTAP